ncbi:hypothetical protein KBD11_00065 [Candidatus Saccharibacteria bacterium]|nr:hypothetical protein [Candidatus Saccharibacteria bacterium]
MAHDDDTDRFLGVTYISHGKDHLATSKSDDLSGTSFTRKSRPKSVKNHDEADSRELVRLQREIAILESALQQYETQTSERLDHLERLAGHPLTPAEKIFQIQEDV